MLRCAQHDNRAPASFRFLVAAMKPAARGFIVGLSPGIYPDNGGSTSWALNCLV